MSDYSNYSFRLVDIGLNLRDAVDKLDNGEWSILDNVLSTQEALITSRKGRISFVDTTSGAEVHSLRRLDDTTLVAGSGTALYRNGTAYSTGGYSGNPLSLTPARPALGSDPWMYIADSAKMRKVSVDGDDHKWGITGPANAVSFAASGVAGNLNSSAAGAVGYDWVATYYSSTTGAESFNSPTSDTVAVVSESATISVTASSDPQVDTIRLYRRGGVNPSSVVVENGVTQANFRLSVETSNVSGTITDDNSDEDIAGNKLLDPDNYVPFQSEDDAGDVVDEVAMPYVWGPFAGKYLMACGDQYRPGYFYWTNANRPDTADIANNLEVTSPREPLQNGFIYFAQPFVFSKEHLYAIDYGGPSTGLTFTSRRTACGRGLAAPWAFTSDAPLIYFVSQDGIYETDGQGPASSLTEEKLRPLFYGESVGGLSPVDFSQPKKIRLAYSRHELHFFYQDTSGNRQELIYHTLYKRWKQATSTAATYVLAYDDENQSAHRILYGTTAGVVHYSSGSLDQGSTAIAVQARTGSMDADRPQTKKEYGVLIVDADPNGNTVTITPWLNAETSSLTALTISGTGRQKFPLSLSDTYAYSIGFDFAWSGQGVKIYQIELLWRMDEEEITHWEFPETTHGYSGWQHIRDAYVAIRSNADVTYTIEVDGTAHTYTLASTGGARRKVYVQLDPVKGKVFRHYFDSGSSFRLYGEDCELRVKQWNTNMGYQLISPFAADQGGT